MKKTATFKELRYMPVEESIYTATHPEVVRWTYYFQLRCHQHRIFARFGQFDEVRSRKTVAAVVGTQWYRFSKFMPWFLCRAAAEVSENRVRHYVIQTAFEELGERREASIHAEMFRDAAMVAGVTKRDFSDYEDLESTTQALKFLRSSLLKAEDDSRVLGLLLGLEIPAVENIETIFALLAHNPSIEKELSAHRFFKLHRCIEIEHVRLTIANFLRFCDSTAKKKEFAAGFDTGVAFWEKFWSGIKRFTTSKGKTNV